MNLDKPDAASDGRGPIPLPPLFDTATREHHDMRPDSSQISQDGKSDIEMSSRQRSSLSSESPSVRRNSFDHDQPYQFQHQTQNRTRDSPVFASCMSPTQMKSEDNSNGSHPNLTSLLSLGFTSPGQRMSLSPKLDSAQFHAPTSVLPRRSRGLDWSRACSSLHQSTLATASTDTRPASSARRMSVPRRRRRRARAASVNAGSPLLGIQSNDTDEPAELDVGGSHFRMVDSESSSDEDCEDESNFTHTEKEDTFMSTPRPLRMINHLSLPFFSPSQSPSSAAKRASFSSSHNGKYNLDDSPLPRSSLSITNTSAHERDTPASSAIMDGNDSPRSNDQYRKMMLEDIKRRRESLGYIIPDFQPNDSNDDDHKGAKAEDPPSRSNTPDSTRHGIHKRPISRPRNLLPKPKPFSRIRAQLQEEGAPVDFDTKREAEVIRQVRVNDSKFDAPSLEQARISTHDGSENAQEPMSITEHSCQTPPSPPSRQDSDNAMMETPPPVHFSSSFSGYHVPYSIESPRPSNKRRRDDFADTTFFKRRAVSPSVSSVNSSPKISPHPRTGSVMSELGTSTGTSASSANNSNINNNDNNNNNNNSGEAAEKALGGKRLGGVHGVTETNDGFMNMRLD